LIIAIDGPAASGKSTVAREVASRLHFRHLDTGAMYRAVTWLALQNRTSPSDAATLIRLANESPVTFSYLDGASIATAVRIGDRDVTTAVRLPEIDANVSAVASVPEVRAALVAQQRKLAAVFDTVVEGRDIGTVVFPAADLKVFLTASVEERARRRQLDHVAQGISVGTDEVQARLEKRDLIDSTRAASPLEVAPDAELLDTTGLTVEEVVDRIVERVEAIL